MKFLEHIKRHKILYSVVLFLLIIVVAFVIKIKQTNAIVGLAGFGGKIVLSYPCTCSPYPAWLIGVSTPKPGLYIFVPGYSVLKANFNIWTPGPWVVGSFIPGVPCIVGFPPVCAPIPTIGTIGQVGTSILI